MTTCVFINSLGHECHEQATFSVLGWNYCPKHQWRGKLRLDQGEQIGFIYSCPLCRWVYEVVDCIGQTIRPQCPHCSKRDKQPVKMVPGYLIGE